ncbi:MAG TPA: hypothetical protein GXX31_04265, partial [Methanothermobacter sp.]|nr:hypothetical protein [Methanothermobacter sp.]
MKKIAPILALVMLVSIIGAGAVAAQEDDLPDGEADLAVDVTLTDSEGNP